MDFSLWEFKVIVCLVLWTWCGGTAESVVKNYHVDGQVVRAPANSSEAKTYFEVADSFGQVCIRARLFPIIRLIYLTRDRTTGVFARETIIDMPDNPLVQGLCNGNEAHLKLVWGGAYSLFFKFQIQGDEWMATQVQFLVNTYFLKTPVTVGIELTRLPLDEQILRTPVGSSYTCDSPTILNMEVPSKTVITECEIEIPSIEVQPFFVPTSGFSPAFQCPLPLSSEINENRIAILVVGCIVGVLIVTGIVIFIVHKKRSNDKGYMLSK